MPRSSVVLALTAVVASWSYPVEEARAAALADPMLAITAGVGSQFALVQTSSTQRRRPVTRRSASAEVGGEKLELSYGLPTTEGREFGELESLQPGGVLRLYSAPALRLRTGLTLQFGQVELPVGNVAAGFPGFYSVWLRRSTDGWELVFNDQADAWGTQYDATENRAVIPLQHNEVEPQQDQLAIEIEATEDGGVLVLRWGTHRWSARFSPAR